MATLIFDEDLTAMEINWSERGIEPQYVSVANDLMVRFWLRYAQPVAAFKQAGLYEKFKKVVHSHNVSGTFYRELDSTLNPQAGDCFRFGLSSWGVAEDFPFSTGLKLTCEDVPGLALKESTMGDSMILGECHLKVVSRTEEWIEVRIK